MAWSPGPNATGGNDVFTGTGGADTADGLAGNDTLNGLGGGDDLFGGAGNDTLDGGDDNDELNGGLGNDSLIGGLGDDMLIDTAGDDDLRGGFGNDTLTANGNSAVLFGDDGADVINAYGVQLVDGGDGDDTVNVFGAPFGGGETLNLQGGAGTDTIAFLSPTFTNFSAANGFEIYLPGDSRIFGTSGADTIDFSALTSGAGSSGLLIQAEGGADVITGTQSGDFIFGGDGNDTLNGEGGNDDISDISGVSTLNGGDGDDILRASGGIGSTVNGGDGNDTLTAPGAAVLDGGAGDDTILLYGAGYGGAMATTLQGGTGNDGIAFYGAELATFGAANGFEDLDGLGDRTVFGTATDNTLDFSVLAVAFVGDGLIVYGGGGNDDLTGTSIDDRLYQEEGSGALVGGGGDDVLTGNAPLDTLRGEEGNDTIVAYGAVLAEGGGGNDLVRLHGSAYGGGFTADVQGGFAVDTLELYSAELEFFEAVSNGFEIYGGGDGVVTGTASANVLDFGNLTSASGSAGLTISGLQGDDVLGGADRADTLNGGEGNDTLRGFAGADSIDGGAGTADLVSFSNHSFGATLTLNGATVSTATIGGVLSDTVVNVENVEGGSGADRLTGDGLANLLIGGAGNDELVGGSGADRLKGGVGADLIDGGVSIADAVDLLDKIEATVVTLAGAVSSIVTVGGVAEDTLINIEHVYTGSGADIVTGDAAINHLYSGLGNDLVKGGAGNDLIVGGAGVDTADYREKTSAVVVTLNTSTNVTVTVNGVAEDTMREVEAIYGGSAADTLTGDFIANSFRGGGGFDVMDGAGGNDTVDFRDKAVAVTLTLNGATAAIATVGGLAQDSVVNIENVIGGSAADTLTGDASVNVLTGAGGPDSLTGAGGADQFAYTAITESAVAARDTITDFTAAQGDKINLSALDADTAVALDQAFTVGALGTAGRLQLTQVSATLWLVEGDVDGGGADFAIDVTSATALTAADFVL